MIFRPPSGTPAELVSGRPLRILRLMLGLRATTASYNQFSLPMRDRQKITICTYCKTELPVPKEISLFEGDGTIRGFFRALRSAMAAGEYDVVHAHSPHVGCFFLIATLLHRRLRRSSVATVHNSYQSFRLRNRLLFLPIFVGFSRIVCCGLASYNSLPSWMKWLAGKRLSFVPNGVDISRIDRALKTNAAGATHEKFTVVSVARLIQVKKPSTLLQAFGQVNDPQSRLVFFGEGLLTAQLATDIRARRLDDRVTLAGLVARDTVYEALRTADLFV
ncbi:MAG TPA: glycosyltransferase, partial [Thermoguttaceae bacterium]|nr:glycosyltransferase [Thermoguttaceae bacterium]